MGTVRAGTWLAIIAASVSLCGGCALQESRREMRSLHAVGAYQAAYERLDEPKSRRLYGSKSELLWLLDRGALELALERPQESVKTLSEAEARMESGHSASLGDEIARWLINDEQAEYLGEPYEDMYTNVLKLAAQLESGAISGGATVEARRMALKANTLRDRHLRAREGASRAAEQEGADGSTGPLAGIASLSTDGEFVESTLGLFLSAVAFMHSGDGQDQAVAARRLQEMARAQTSIIGPVDPVPFGPLETMTAQDANVAIVAFSGRGPYKVPLRLPPLLIHETPVYVELPVLRWDPSEVGAVRVTARPAGEESAGTSSALHFVESIAQVADENHKRELPAIYFRTLARAAAKSVGLTYAASAARHGADSGDAGLAVALGGLALLLWTERADVRAWEFLPGQAHVGLLSLAPGAHEVRVEYLDAFGRVVHATGWRPANTDERGLTTIVEHYWR